METESDGEACGGSEPGAQIQIDVYSQILGTTVSSSESETEESEWKEARESQSGLNSQKRLCIKTSIGMFQLLSLYKIFLHKIVIYRNTRESMLERNLLYAIFCTKY